MQEPSDTELLRQYAEQDSEAAFETLVSRHVNLVYSAALRKTGNFHAAEEVSQAVFIILAQKAHALRKGTILSGWLYQAARLTAANVLRGEIRRARREQEANMQSCPNEPEIWSQIIPLLEDAMGRLNEKDRNAVLLRFFEGKSFHEISAACGGSENAAKKRVAYALEKLRKFFARRGVASTTAAIGSAISANSIQAAPVGLAKTISTAAVAKGAAASASTLTLVKGALKLMAWTKTQTAIVAGAVLLLAAGTTTITVKKIAAYETWRDSWLRPPLSSDMLDQSSPQVRILPTRFPGKQQLVGTLGSAKWEGLDQPVSAMMRVAYQWPPARVVFTNPEPPGQYDFIASLPRGSCEALQHELKNQFGLVGRVETRDRDVLVLKVRIPNAPGLKPPLTGGEKDYWNEGEYVCDDCPLSTDVPPSVGLQNFLEDYLEVPVVDETGLTNHFSIRLKWPDLGPNHKGLKEVLLDQLGLELVPTNMPIDMLVVEKP